MNKWSLYSKFLVYKYNPYLIDNYIKVSVINKIDVHNTSMWKFSQDNPMIEIMSQINSEANAIRIKKIKNSSVEITCVILYSLNDILMFYNILREEMRMEGE